jgi:hypothetical protein
MGVILDEAEKLYKEMDPKLRSEAITAIVKDVEELVASHGGTFIAGFAIPDGKGVWVSVVGKGNPADHLLVLSKLTEGV